MFIATHGLAILENGECDGKWSEPNKYMSYGQQKMVKTEILRNI